MTNKNNKKIKNFRIDTGGYSSLEDSGNGEINWNHDINLEKERS